MNYGKDWMAIFDMMSAAILTSIVDQQTCKSYNLKQEKLGDLAQNINHIVFVEMKNPTVGAKLIAIFVTAVSQCVDQTFQFGNKWHGASLESLSVLDSLDHDFHREPVRFLIATTTIEIIDKSSGLMLQEALTIVRLRRPAPTGTLINELRTEMNTIKLRKVIYSTLMAKYEFKMNKSSYRNSISTSGSSMNEGLT